MKVGCDHFSKFARKHELEPRIQRLICGLHTEHDPRSYSHCLECSRAPPRPGGPGREAAELPGWRGGGPRPGAGRRKGWKPTLRGPKTQPQRTPGASHPGPSQQRSDGGAAQGEGSHGLQGREGGPREGGHEPSGPAEEARDWRGGSVGSALPVCERSSVSVIAASVTGGSSGIGKCIAIECYKQGAFITLVARNEDRLLQAKKEIEKHSINDKQVVLCISVDVSQDYNQVENVIKQAQEKLGPVDMLVNCAGLSLSGKFEDLEVSTFEKLMSVNYLGSVYPSRAVITTMKERRVGRIVFVSSQAGQLGLFGFTAYSSSKFAIRGLAEALQMEVKPYNVYVTVAYPPDTDTPGFAEENKTKPLETRLISETTSVCKPEQVAKQIVKDAIQGNFNSSIGSDGYMLSALTCGMAPVTSITEGLQQVVTMGLFRTIALFYLGSFDSIIRRCMMQRAKSEIADKTD
ncbi:3-ketodihydrosphingosine reductase [Marmota marmota marmota]|uniref:3-ketodihydrosphingosine reductase n=1 Tax=Marmota marmota marmota TaxID=9994 RepID=UPI002093FD44|nr:3-ketodihydrosphingosine reductase [Marmota marmota marmota]